MDNKPGQSVPDESVGYENVLNRDPSGFWKFFRGRSLGSSALTVLGVGAALATVSAVVFEQEAQAGLIPTCEMTPDGVNAIWWVTQDGVDYGPFGPWVFFPAGVELEPGSGIYYDGVTYEASARCGNTTPPPPEPEPTTTTTTTEAPTTTDAPVTTTEAPVTTTEAPATTTTTLSPGEQFAVDYVSWLETDYARLQRLQMRIANKADIGAIYTPRTEAEVYAETSTTAEETSTTTPETSSSVVADSNENSAAAGIDSNDTDDGGNGFNFLIPVTVIGTAALAGAATFGAIHHRNRKKGKTTLPPVSPTGSGSPAR